MLAIASTKQPSHPSFLGSFFLAEQPTSASLGAKKARGHVAATKQSKTKTWVQLHG